MTKGNFLIKLDESQYNKQLQVSAGGVEQAAQALYDQVLEGKATAVQVAEMINFVAKVGDAVKVKTDEQGKNAFVDLVRAQIEADSKDGKKVTTKYGTTLELAETSVKYTFDVCKDPLWDYYTSQIEELKELKAEREKFLKTIKKEYPIGNVVIPSNGEIFEDVTLYPPIKTSVSSYKQTLLKD